MSQVADPVTFSLPRDLLADVSRLSGQLIDRMHELLERHNDDQLQPTEKAELDTLVRMAEFSQIISAALRNPGGS